MITTATKAEDLRHCLRDTLAWKKMEVNTTTKAMAKISRPNQGVKW
jgi:hypothetical protein